MMTGPVRAILRLKNNRVMESRKALGFATAKAAADAAGISYTHWVAVESMRWSPIAAGGGWKPIAQKISGFLGSSPWYLWPDSVQSITASKSLLTERVLSEEHALLLIEQDAPTPAIPEEIVLRQEERNLVAGAIERFLSPRDQFIVRAKMDDRTLEEIASDLSLSRERVRQLHGRALRKLRDRLAPRLGKRAVQAYP